jgi:hypothetical protein
MCFRIAHAQHECGLRVLDQLVHQVDALDLVIFGGGGAVFLQ